MASAHLNYCIGDRNERADLEHIVEVTERFSKGQKTVAELFPDIKVQVWLSTTGGNVADPIYRTSMKAESKDRLRLGLYAFFEAAGLPYFVNDGSSYADVDAALSKYGKKTKRSLFGAAVGRRVVDKER